MEEICYLCAGPIVEGEECNKDHVVQHQLITRAHPIARGFDYGGFLPTHSEHNNAFGGRRARTEDTWRTALQLGNALHDENCFKLRQRVDSPDVVILAFREECLKAFRKDDLRFFGITDVRGKAYHDWSDPLFWKDKNKVVTYEKPCNVILSVLAKSAAAILVKRCGIAPNASWRILASLIVGDNVSVLADEFFKATQPFDKDLIIKAKETETGDWVVFYVVGKIAALFSFAVSKNSAWFDSISEEFKEWGCYIFESDKLLNLIGYEWTKNVYSKNSD